MENDSTFSIFKIGPRLAELLSIIENQKYYCKIADYNANVWDWNEQYPSHIDDINESCFILTTDTDVHPVFGENICLSYRYANQREDDSTCLGLINYNHKYRDYQNIVDGKITFYDYTNNDENRLIRLPHEDIMYEYINEVIKYMKDFDNYDLSIIELQSLLKIFAEKNGLLNNKSLQRKKGINNDKISTI